MSWKECIDEFNAIKIRPDFEKSRSLIKTADARINFIKRQKIDDNSGSFILEAYYSSVVEYLHAILKRYGYKVNNHICLGYYIRDIMDKESLYRIFDDNRKRRNQIVYHGKMIKIETAKQSIGQMKELIKELKILSE